MTPGKRDKVGLAMAGGGPAGAIYEIGAIRGLEEAVEGLNLNDLGVYLGLSAGAFLAATLANDMPTDLLCRAVCSTEPGEHPFEPEIFLTPAFGEFFRSTSQVPSGIMAALKDYLGNHDDRRVFKSLTRLGRAIPTGLFDNRPIRSYLEKVFTRPGRTNDFNELKKKLYVVAADLDSGEAIIFGRDRTDIPIAQAIQASSALPGLYPPVLIDGRYYVDGVLHKTLHASTVLDAGVQLAICINPIVPVNTRHSVESGYMRRGKLIDRGMPTVLSQTFRTMIHSRLITGFAAYEDRYTDKDIVLIEPSKEDYRMFFTNIFSFSSRKWVCEHAYNSTFRNLSNRRDELGPIFERHGYRLRTEILDNPPNIWDTVGLRRRKTMSKPALELSDALNKLDHCLRRLEYAEKAQSE